VTGTILVDVPNDEPVLARVIFGIVIPLMSVVFLLLWYSELVRMFRASNHLGGLEERINDKVGEDALTWEHGKGVEDRRKKFFRPYMLVIVAFTLVGMAAPAVGVAITDYGFKAHTFEWLLQIFVGIVLIVALLLRARKERMGDRSQSSA
jgi:hypothetical protein